MPESPTNKLQVFSLQVYQKNDSGTDVLLRVLQVIFFKYTSRLSLLKEHWILLKMVPITIVIDVSNISYQKDFELFSFFRSTYGKFVKISIETFINLFLLLGFCLPSER